VTGADLASSGASASPPWPSGGPRRRIAIPKMVVSHAVVDIDRWLQGKAERAAVIGAYATNVTDHVAADGSNNIAVTGRHPRHGGLAGTDDLALARRRGRRGAPRRYPTDNGLHREVVQARQCRRDPDHPSDLHTRMVTRTRERDHLDPEGPHAMRRTGRIATAPGLCEDPGGRRGQRGTGRWLIVGFGRIWWGYLVPIAER
jgi:hypothetical protein